MICILHGYLLEGSGSNLWTRAVVQSLCRNGETIHLVCQENHAEEYDFIAEQYHYGLDGSVETMFKRGVPYPGRCILHKPQLGDTLPVYVWDRYEEFPNVVPMVELSDEAINNYLRRNTEVVLQIVRVFGITAMHANHAVLISVVAEQVSAATSIPFTIMPHGSDIEYAVKKDGRFLRLATSALTAAKRIFVHGQEMRERVNKVFSSVPGIEDKMKELHLGVDTSLFEPMPRGLRQKNVTRLLETLAGVPRGKTPELSEGLRERLSGEMAERELRLAIQSASNYAGKQPDADLEAKLAAVDWADDKILLFVGRLISSKGLQSIIAALPLILDKHPTGRLLVVGHGPLREPIEVMLWALEHGKISLVERIIECGSSLEGLTGRAFTAVRCFYDHLSERGELNTYFEKARQYLRADRVIFTGYLTHRELRYLFPCCDVAIFPSVVAEAGPLVFIEALASGCFPLGTYFAGMAASIDSVAAALSTEDAKLMKLSAKEEKTVADLVANVGGALHLGEKYKMKLREAAVEHYDWKNVARKLASELLSLAK
jgi:glycosyltransferase involved in cell wall biosynthesis